MARWADYARVSEAVEAYAAALRTERPEVSRILWYGSWVGGLATPRSDVDVCIVVRDDPRPARERVPDYLPERFPTGIDLTVLTEAEFEGLEERAPSWHRAIAAGRSL